MTVLVHDLMTQAAIVREPSRIGLKAETYTDLAQVEALWRALEGDPGALMTPYQRFDWVASYIEAEFGAVSDRRARAVRIVVVRDAADRPRVLIPLRVAQECGVRVARVVGEKHANIHMPLFASREAAAMSPEELTEALASAGSACGIDLFALNFQPRFWEGAANPLGTGGRPCPSDAYGLLLGPDPDATLRRAYSGEARKKLRAKERKLVELVGPVEHRVATSPEAIEATLAAFYAQKAARMAALGTFDPYDIARIRRFFALATRLDGARFPAMELHALVAREGGRILATFCGAVDRERFSGMWTSYDADPALSRFSPGDILLHRLIGQQTAAGRRAFDLGVGEARYKASICDETIELAVRMIPVTLPGHLFALGESAAARVKRAIKRSPRLRGAWRWVFPRKAISGPAGFG